MAVVDVNKDEIVKTIEFPSETGMPQYDSSVRKVYINLRSTNEIAEIDPSTDTLLGKYPVDGCQFNHGMAVDSEHHRAFILCSGNRTFTIFALDTRKSIAHLPMPAGADVVKFDPSLGRIYVACSSGFISVFETRTRNTIESSKTARSRKWSTVLPWIRQAIVCMHLSNKKKDSRLHA